MGHPYGKGRGGGYPDKPGDGGGEVVVAIQTSVLPQSLVDAYFLVQF